MKTLVPILAALVLFACSSSPSRNQDPKGNSTEMGDMRSPAGTPTFAAHRKSKFTPYSAQLQGRGGAMVCDQNALSNNPWAHGNEWLADVKLVITEEGPCQKASYNYFEINDIDDGTGKVTGTLAQVTYHKDFGFHPLEITGVNEQERIELQCEFESVRSYLVIRTQYLKCTGPAGTLYFKRN